MSDFQELTGIELLKRDRQSLSEKTWKERVRNAQDQEQRWIAQALPDYILQDEIDRRYAHLKRTVINGESVFRDFSRSEQERLGVR